MLGSRRGFEPVYFPSGKEEQAPGNTFESILVLGIVHRILCE
jgi:hypothetical protein